MCPAAVHSVTDMCPAAVHSVTDMCPAIVHSVTLNVAYILTINV